jgi:hypothetical protein
MKKVTEANSKKSTAPDAKTAARGSTTPKPKVDRKKMNPDLEKKCEVIKGLLVVSDLASLKARRDIGKHVTDVEHGAAKYGEGAVANLAKALGRDSDTLYDCAHVFALLVNEKLGKVWGARSVHGMPLSFSHWVVIANVCENALKNGAGQHDKKAHEEDVKKAEGLALNALEKGWSVRTLKVKANPEKEGATQDIVTRLSTTLTSTKTKLAENIDAVVAELSTDNVPAERIDDGRKLLDLLCQVRDAAAKGANELEQALESASTDPEETEAPESDPPEPTESTESTPAFFNRVTRGR